MDVISLGPEHERSREKGNTDKIATYERLGADFADTSPVEREDVSLQTREASHGAVTRTRNVEGRPGFVSTACSNEPTADCNGRAKLVGAAG